MIINGLKKSKRPINRIFIHCSATPEGREHDVEDIRRWHKAKGWSDVGYHYVIKIDGTVEEGRSVNIDGAHSKGQNQDSIAICYIGGLNKGGKKSKDTRTDAQRDSLDDLLECLKAIFPKATLHGHNEFSSKECPSFNVQEEYFYYNNNTVKTITMTQEFEKPHQDIQDFEVDESFADFVNELTEDKANANAVCSIDDDSCDSCGA